MGWDTYDADPRDGAEPMDTPPAEDEHGPHVAPPSVFTEAERWRPIGPEWLIEEPPPRRYLLDYVPKDRDGRPKGECTGLLPAGRVGFLVGAGAAGKSYALCSFALGVATGRDPFAAKDHPSPIEVSNSRNAPGPGPVALIMAEEEADEIRRRLYFTAKLMGLKDADHAHAARRIVALPLSGEHVSLVYQAAYGDAPELLSQVGDDLDAALREHVPQGEDGWRLVVLDPLARFAGADAEKDNNAATRFVEVLERLTRVDGNPTVLTAHHTSQVARLGGSTDATAARGVTGLTDGARWIANIAGETIPEGYTGPALCRIDFSKQNYSAHVAPFMLARDRDHLGSLRAASEAEGRALAEAIDAAKDEKKRAKKEKKADTARPEAPL
jgi:RecA-family ATPase